MNCEYPCHICEPDAWEEERNPERSWDALHFDIRQELRGLEKKLDCAVLDAGLGIPLARHLRGPIWWTLLTPWPSDIDFTTERDVEDFYPTYGSSPITVLNNQRTYMHTGHRTYPILAYRQRADFEKQLFWVDAIQTSHLPAWGWWMPTLWGG